MNFCHPALVALHWIMAVLIPVSLMIGGFVLSNIPLDHPGKAEALQGHMIAGAVIGVLLLLRLTVRRWTKRPPPANSGNSVLNGAA
ncbi:cytochrome b/b6 domain-containing protein [Roseobacter sp. YSTF-M11]|uniref:Cytochrome b/b6 domain-containing protein n=1 Tax=Roseobacter insulae TaxID=2859783 RepID=A0A9X1K5F6_9RHOB|nr:cytochrome b/b6 domain-containing protein [Roseobacter insulae]